MTQEMTHYLYELGQLRRIKHEGWRLAGIEQPDSVADHSLRAAQIGYCLAVMENYENPFEVVTMLVFHDAGECRTGDIHKVANRYVTSNEKLAIEEQTETLPLQMKETLRRLWNEMHDKSTTAGVIAKDADILELALTAKEFQESGYNTTDWLNNIPKRINTLSANQLFEEILQTSPLDWWKKLKCFNKNDLNS